MPDQFDDRHLFGYFAALGDSLAADLASQGLAMEILAALYPAIWRTVVANLFRMALLSFDTVLSMEAKKRQVTVIS